MKYIKKFDQHSDYADYKESQDFTRPNISVCGGGDGELHYNKLNGDKFISVVSSDGGSVYVIHWNDFGKDNDFPFPFSEIEVDGVDRTQDVIDGEGMLQLTAGEHVVKYTLDDPNNTEYLFWDVANMLSVVIPDTTTELGLNMFNSALSLKNVNLPDELSVIGIQAFDACANMRRITIPDGVVEIGSHAFGGCSSLLSVRIPDSVTTIGDHVFFQCTSLLAVDLGTGITQIGESTFARCANLRELEIPEGITAIGRNTFEDCFLLESVIMRPTTPPTLGADVFIGCSNFKIYVPQGSLTTYRTATGWSDYASSIRAITE